MNGSVFVDFNGLVEEFPGLGVDRFNTNANVYLLTHCHTDHLVGLSAASFRSKVYCSHTTKSILGLNPDYSHILPYLIPINYNSPFELHTDPFKIMVTPIPAYHCPGACMFLVESDIKSVLITGDVRIEDWWLNNISTNASLSPYVHGTKRLSNIYLDTTFGYRGEPYIEINSNTEGIGIIIDILKSYPMDDPQICFNFLDQVLGFEEAWASIVHAFEGRLVVTDLMKRRISVIGMDSIVSYAELLINLSDHKKSKGPIFKVAQGDETKFQVNIKQCINFNIVDFTGIFLPVSIQSLREDEFELVFTTNKGNQIYKYNSRAWILPKGGTELLPSELKLLFSRHASFSECRRLVCMFKPCQVYPCVSSPQMWKSGFSMYRLFGDLCTNDRADYSYDISMFKQFGYPERSILERRITVINRWKFEDCLDEYNMVTNYMATNYNSSNHSILKGQLHNYEQFQLKNNLEVQVARAKDFKLQTIIAGRSEARYKAIIQKNQELYRARPKIKSRITHDYHTDSEEDDISDNESIQESFSENGIVSKGPIDSDVDVSPSKIDQISLLLTQDPFNWFDVTLQSLESNLRP
ncbi:hypothetical protein DFJ63DRAFT_377 [Scheffersomyces coipomensis]|uniref:uncharacterized protein n=1 Tax=Scheffersomyces coipomensis TaxID=1788519 RepID=UPI00315CC468